MFGRVNKIGPNYTKFDISPFKKVFNQDRLEHVNVVTSIPDPYQTVDPHKDPLIYKDPGAVVLNKRN